MKNQEEIGMNINDDTFLTSLLQYHTRLIDQQFVDDIISNIKAKNILRFRLLIGAMLIACSVTIPLILSSVNSIELWIALPELSPYVMTFASLSVIGFFVWFTSEEF
jgi:hypothetical protein